MAYEKRSEMMKESPMATIIVFAFLGIAGVVMAVVGGNNVTGFNQTILVNLGSAVFGGALAFFLIEMFRWSRERKKK